jgi:hypothetical protein
MNAKGTNSRVNNDYHGAWEHQAGREKGGYAGCAGTCPLAFDVVPCRSAPGNRSPDHFNSKNTPLEVESVIARARLSE